MRSIGGSCEYTWEKGALRNVSRCPARPSASSSKRKIVLTLTAPSRQHRILAFSPPPNFPDAARFFNSVTQYLESPSTSPLDLSTPWKGARLHSTGKKERVSGLRSGSSVVGVEGVPQDRLWAQVWRQQAVKANRKVYLPTIMSALQKAAKAV